MTSYYIKPPISGWYRVNQEQYNRFIEHIRKNATGLSAEEKEEYIKKVTKVIGGDKRADN